MNVESGDHVPDEDADVLMELFVEQDVVYFDMERKASTFADLSLGKQVRNATARDRRMGDQDREVSVKEYEGARASQETTDTRSGKQSREGDLDG